MHIMSLEHTIFTFAANKHMSAGIEDFVFANMIGRLDQESFDFEDQHEKPLFRRALKKLGALGPDEMYAVEPSLSFGGSAQLSTLVKVKMEEHLNFLARLGEIEVLHLAPTSDTALVPAPRPAAKCGATLAPNRRAATFPM